LTVARRLWTVDAHELLKRADAPIVVSMIVAAALRMARLLEARASDPLYAAHLSTRVLRRDGEEDRRRAGRTSRARSSMAPLYGYFLAGVYRVFGTEPTPVYAIQVVLGTVTAASPRGSVAVSAAAAASWIAGLSVAIYAQLVLYDVRLCRCRSRCSSSRSGQ
jgi:hypothetical protein